MYKNKKILAIIPARKGSKGIKNKNITLLQGKPLISYAIHQALKSDYIDRVVVSTDSEEIKNISQQYGAEVPFLRPVQLSGDRSKSIDVVLHCLDFLEKQNQFDYVILLQPTSPLRKVEHIDKAIEELIDKNGESLVSMCEAKENPVIMRIIEDNKLKEVINFEGDNLRRQELPVFYKINGAIYINSVKMLKNNNQFIDENTLPFIMDYESSVDIDDSLDLKFTEVIMENK